MKKSVLMFLVVFFVAMQARAQSTFLIQFQNWNGTSEPGGSPIINALTGTRVAAGTNFLVQLYFGPAGTSDDALMAVPRSPIGFFAPGFFDGGTRLLLAPAPGSRVRLQIRSWEARLGPSYEAAVSACDAGDLGLIGRSASWEQAATAPTAPPATLTGLRSFGLRPCLELAPIAIRVSEVELCWPSQVDRHYRVDYRTQLSTSVWQTLYADIPGNGTTNCVTDAIAAGQLKRFYRAVVLPPE